MGDNLSVGHGKIMAWTNPNIQQVVPLARLGAYAPGAIGIPAVGTTPVNVFPVSAGNNGLINVIQFASYDLNLLAWATSPGAAGAAITLSVTINWYDDLASSIPVFTETWWPWVARNENITSPTLAASGPMHGTYMQILVSGAPDQTSNLNVQYINVYGSNRVVPYSDWRQNSAIVQPECFGLNEVQDPAATSFENILVNLNHSTLIANLTYFIPFGLYAGPVFVTYQQGAATPVTATIMTVAGLSGGDVIAGTTGPGVIYSFPDTDTSPQYASLILPRAACCLVVETPSANMSFTISVIAQQAS